MTISLENSTDTIKFGSDTALARKGSNAIATPGSLDVAELSLTSGGITFPDSSVQLTAATGGGSSTPPTVYDTTLRYHVVSTVGQAVIVTASSPVKPGISWIRTGTSLVLTDAAHGHIVGDRVLVRNTNVDLLNALITGVTANTFTVTCADSGATSGTSGAYSMGLTFAHNASGAANITSGTFTLPNGVTNITILAVRIHLAANTRTGTSYQLTIPGTVTDMDNITIPVQAVRGDGANLSAVGATLACAVGGDWQKFQVAALAAATVGTHITMIF